MTFKEIQELIRQINRTGLTEFRLKDGEFEILIRSKNFEKISKAQPQQIVQVPSMPAVAPAFQAPAAPAAPEAKPAAPAEAPAAKAEAKDDTSKYVEVRSPIVGTFYRSPGPDKDVFVKVGDTIGKGSVVCIVEAMKLFNEIESEVSGKIVKVMVEDASPVEFDQVLFLVDPKG